MGFIIGLFFGTGLVTAFLLVIDVRNVKRGRSRRATSEQSANQFLESMPSEEPDVSSES